VSREIRSRIIDEAGTLIGYRGLSGPRDATYRDSWVERAKQVGRDIRMGFRYFVVMGDAEVDATADAQLAVSALSDSGDVLAELETSDSPIALDHLNLNEANPDLYRMERLAR
jgi:alkanesulfonate monooxygenase SsuD/methylene tetrahydromethanopterin reductase-like flavin-dependent oxidoreductase (luciferase family)